MHPALASVLGLLWRPPGFKESTTAGIGVPRGISPALFCRPLLAPTPLLGTLTSASSVNGT